jgi:glucosyl-3-phosphoglycerate synthase
MKLTDLAHDTLSGIYPPIDDHRPARSTSVCLLTLNEHEHIERSLDLLRPALADGSVAGLWVADGGSTDGTRDLVRSAGVNLISLEEVLPEFGPVLGKGDSMWRAFSVLPGDVFVFLDADIDGDLAGAARNLSAPIRTNPSTHFVKGYFTRQQQASPMPGNAPGVGGRVTETVARPLIAQVAPWLSGIREPLSGQVAMSRSFAMRTPVVTGYGLEIGMLFDAAMTLGVDNIAQVDIGEILNPRKPGSDLDDMGVQVMSTLVGRVMACHGDPNINSQLGHLVTTRLPERPPMISVTGDPASQ